MKSLNKLMRERLFFEWKLSSVPNGDTLITELHGISSEVEDITKECGKIIEPLLFEFNSKEETIDKYVTAYIRSEFAEQISIHLIIKFGAKRGKTTSAASYSPSNSLYNKSNNKFDVVAIELKLWSGMFSVCLADVLPSIAHELTHAYEDWNRKTTGADDLKASSLKNGYYKALKTRLLSKTDLEQNLSMLMYITTKSERNAFIATIISEIKPFLANCNTSRKAYDLLVKKSKTYKTLIKYDEVIKEFNNISYISLKNALIYRWNYITGERVTDYNVFLKRLTKRWYLFKKRLVSSLGKQIADAAFENPNWFYLKPFSTDDF